MHLKCVACPGDRFEPEHTRSSLFSVIPGCTYKHLPPEQLTPHLVKYEIGSKSSPTKWTCDYVKGYYEKNGHLIINDFPSHSYECVKKNCPAGTLLRPGNLSISICFYAAYISLQLHLHFEVHVVI